QMKQARIEAVELEIEHERDVLERKPVRGRPMSEGPIDPVPRETGIYLRNFVDVFGVIKIEERKFDCLPKHEPNERDQTGADARDEPTVSDGSTHSSESDRAVDDVDGKDRFLPESARQVRVGPEHGRVLTRFDRPRSRFQIHLLPHRPRQGSECKTDYFAG